KKWATTTMHESPWLAQKNCFRACNKSGGQVSIAVIPTGRTLKRIASNWMQVSSQYTSSARAHDRSEAIMSNTEFVVHSDLLITVESQISWTSSYLSRINDPTLDHKQFR